MSASDAGGIGRSLCHHAAALAFGVILMGMASVTSAQQSATSQAPDEYVATLHVSDLEHAFWVCDYTATSRGVHATPMALCAAVTDQLKKVRFGGSFEDMLAWWRKNKPAEHGKLDSGTM